MKRQVLSIGPKAAQPNYDATRDLAELDKRNARNAVRAKYIKAALITAALVLGGAAVANWQSIASFFRQ